MATERKKQQDRDRMQRKRAEIASRVERLHGFLSQMILWLQYLNVHYPDERPEINALISQAQKEMMRE